MSVLSEASRATVRAGVLALALAAALSSAANAQEVMAMHVNTTAGEVFQGQLAELVPGDHVTIKLATGEQKTFKWSEILPPTGRASGPGAGGAPMSKLEVLQAFEKFKAIEKQMQALRDFEKQQMGGAGGDSVTRTETRTDARIGATPAVPDLFGVSRPYTGADGVTVHLEMVGTGYDIAFLYQAAAGGPSVGWRRLCMVPCNQRVDPHGLYRIDSGTIRASKKFRLPSGAAETTLYVDPGTVGVFPTGLVFTGLGLVQTLIGAYVYTTAPASDASTPLSTDESRMSHHLTGGILMGVAAPFVISGLLMVLSGTTTVRTDSGASLARVGAKAPPLPGFRF